MTQETDTGVCFLSIRTKDVTIIVLNILENYGAFPLNLIHLSTHDKDRNM